MAEPNWIKLITDGLTLADRTYHLLARSAPRSGQAERQTTQARGRDPQRVLQTAHRVLDVLEGRPQRRGLF
ncbi:MAG: hypothetical protein ACM3XZ_12090 [Betaproteobacteria bacterium]